MLKRTTTRGRRALVSSAALVLLLLLPSSPSTAGGGSNCSQSGSEVHVDLMADGALGILQRNAAGLILYQEEGATSAQPCGTANVFTTTKIEIEDTTSDGGTVIILDVSQGDFSDGTNDIPITVDLGTGSVDAFGLIGSSAADHWTFGSSQSGLSRGNLQNNGSAEIKFLSHPDFGFGTSRGGNDRACSLGGSSRGIPRKSLVGWVWIGGGGTDTLCGGIFSDRLVGKAGNDNLRGGAGGDVLKGGGDADRLKGAAGGDLLRGNQGSDVLRGGGGRDRCGGGPGADQESNCER